MSKNSRSMADVKPTSRGEQAARHRSALYIEDGVERDRLAQLRLDLPPRVLGDQDLDLERIDQERQ